MSKSVFIGAFVASLSLSGCAALDFFLNDGSDGPDRIDQAESHQASLFGDDSPPAERAPHRGRETAAAREQHDDRPMGLSPTDIALGMPMGVVRMAWGAPVDIETAGDPRWGNARWIYRDGMTRLASTRIVYFEDGHVVGWEM